MRFQSECIVIEVSCQFASRVVSLQGGLALVSGTGRWARSCGIVCVVHKDPFARSLPPAEGLWGSNAFLCSRRGIVTFTLVIMMMPF
jgi:hypothetical protein